MVIRYFDKQNLNSTKARKQTENNMLLKGETR